MEQLILWFLSFFSFLGSLNVIKRLKDQRGEADPDPADDDPPDDDPGTDDLIEGLDDVTLEGLDLDEEEEEPEEEEEDGEPDKKSPEGVLEKLQGQVGTLEKRLNDKETHIKNLNVALHQARQEKKGKDTEEEAPLTDQQLLGLFKEHQNDPGTLFNIIKYVAQQSAKGVEKKAVDASQIAQKKSDIDNRLIKAYPDLAKDDSELRTGVNSVKTDLNIDDHPYGDLFALGVMTMNNLETLMKQARDEGKQEALKGKVEDKRKETVKKNALTPGGEKPSKAKQSSTELSGKALDVAKQMGLNKSQSKLYARLISKKSNMVEV